MYGVLISNWAQCTELEMGRIRNDIGVDVDADVDADFDVDVDFIVVAELIRNDPN